MVRVRRYTLALVACGLVLFGAGRSGLLSVLAAPEYALQFDGVNDHVTFGRTLGAQNFTLELWFMRTGAGVAASSGTGGVSAIPLVTKGRGEGEGSAVDMNYFLGIDSATRVLTADFEDFHAGLNHPVAGKTIICDNIWYHAAATYDGTTWRLYLNGDLEAELTVAIPLSPNQRVPRFDSIQHAGFGTAMTSDGTVQGFFRGMMDEVRIWNVARSQAEIRDLMDEALLVVPGGLIGRWGLDDGPGSTTAATSVGSTNNGTLMPVANPPVWVAGGSGYAPTPIVGNQGLRLVPTSTTVGSYVTFGAATATLGTPQFTVETWFKREAAGFPANTGTGGMPTAIPLVTKGTSEGEKSNVDMNYFLGINVAAGGAVIAADFEEDGPPAGPTSGLNHPVSGTTPIVMNTWYHAAVTYDGTTLRLYLNGLPEGSPVTVGKLPRFDSIQHAGLGTSMTSTGARQGFFAGILDEARIWNYARTPAQMLASYNREIPTANGLLGRWGFNECCGRVADSSGNVPLATAVGSGVTWVTPVSPATSWPLSIVVNMAPVVDAGADFTTSLPGGALMGSVSDDGVDVGLGPVLTSAWSQTSGPLGSTVTFTPANTPITTATFSTVGTYVLTLTANDGERSTSDSVTINVIASGGNLPPTAIAGPDQVITFPANASLTGSYTDDGLPGVDVETVWSFVSGPGTVTIAQSQELNTTASFSAPGAYVLSLTANDGALTGSDTVSITVNPAPTPHAIDLGGSNAYVAFGQAPGLGASVFTLEAWIMRQGPGVATSTGSSGLENARVAIPIVSKGRAQADDTNVDMNYFLGIDNQNGVLAADFEEGAGGVDPGLNHPVWGKTAIPMNEWHHVAVTYDGTAWRLYLDGTLDIEGDQPLVVGQPPRSDSVQHAAIGSALNSTGVAAGFFNGAIDEVRIWNVARSQEQIQDGMTGEILSAANLIGRWGFNEGTGGPGTLISGLGATGTANGTFGWVPGAPFAPPNNAPDAPVLTAPANAAPNVQSPATLKVSVSDSDGGPLTVTYYGRPKPQAAAPDFTLVTIPDTQHYTDNATHAPKFTAQTNWIVANRDPLNIAFVSHLGDIAEHQDQLEIEWQRADTSMSVLDANAVPYGVSPGNHDQAPSGVAAFFDQYFPPSRFLGQPWYGGYMGAEPDDSQNRLNKDNYELFSVGGLDFLIIHIEHDWPGYAVEWADKIIKRYPNRRVILSTHLFLNTSSARPTSSQFRGANGTSAEDVWQDLVKPNCNVFMVVNGHYPGEGRRTDPNVCGKPVHQVLMDYQSRPNGGDGWLRYFTFKPSQNKIYAYTFSPTRNGGIGEFETDDSSQFVLDYDMATPFQVIYTDPGVGSGSESTATWTLPEGTEAEWYVTVSDGKKTTTGPVWSFTTEVPNAAPAAQADAYDVDEDGVLTVPAPGVLANDTDADDGDTLSAALVDPPSHGTVSLSANGSFTYTPAADYHGADSFTYKANDGSADSNVTTVAITVNSVNDAPVAVGDSYSVDEDHTLTVAGLGVLANDTDAENNPLTAVLVAGPTNGTLTFKADGSFTYAPNANFNGSDSFTYKANDGTDDSNVATVAITVDAANDAPVANNDSHSTAEDTALTVTAPGVLGNDTDAENSPLTAVLVAGPTNGTLTLNADGSFTYAPNANFNGSDSFTYKANDGTDDSNVATVAITVDAANDAPVANNDSHSTAEDTALMVAAPGVLGNDTDAENNPLTAVLVAGPTNGTLTFNADGSFTFAPNANFNGSDSFTYKTSDGMDDSNVATVAITVDAANDAPVANDDSHSTAEDTTLTVAAPGVLGNDTDVENSPLTAVLVAGPTNGTLTLNGDGSFTYAPNADFNGSDSFTYKANDGTDDSKVATVTITVDAANDAPVAVDDSYTTGEDTGITVGADGVLGNDTDIDGDGLQAVIVSEPTHGTLTLNADGSFTYTPAAEYNGPDAFTYMVNDGSADSNVATVSMTVEAVNDAPVARTDSYAIDEDAVLAITAGGVLGNDSDVEGSSLLAVLSTGPSHGTLTLNADGTFTYTPDANYSGPDGFTYKASDGAADSDGASVSLVVNAINDAPVAANDGFTTDEDMGLTIAAAGLLGNDTDIDDTSLQAKLVSGPSRGTLTLNANGSFSYLPAANVSGVDSFSYRASDGVADSAIATVAITIRPVNDLPAAQAQEVLTEINDAVSIVLAAVDEEGSPLTYRIVSGPHHGTLSGVLPNLQYTPAKKYVGPDSVTFVANDGVADSNVATVSITVVKEINNPPVAHDQSIQTDEDTRVQIELGADDPDGKRLKFHVVTEPAHGTLSGSGRQVRYKPDPNYYGPDSFRFKVSDNAFDSNVATVNITVSPVNDAPVATRITVSTSGGDPVSGMLVATDVDGDSLTYRLVTAPKKGDVTIDKATGRFTYTPDDRRRRGQDRFTYVANDGKVDSKPAKVIVNLDGKHEWDDWDD